MPLNKSCCEKLVRKVVDWQMKGYVGKAVLPKIQELVDFDVTLRPIKDKVWYIHLFFFWHG